MLFRERTIRPSPPRATVFDDGGRLRIVIPPPRHWLVMLFMAGWSVGWAVALVSTVRELAAPTHRGGGSQAFLIVWLTLWIVGGGWVFCLLLYMLFGREIVQVDDELLTIANRVPVYTRSRRFGLREVRDLRVSSGRPQYARWWGTSAGFPGYEGAFAFDYGAKTYRFGAGVDEAEAKQLLAVILERFPVLAAK